MKEDDEYILGDTYGYDQKIVEGRESCKITPKPGLLAFFNSRNFHEVKQSQTIRLSIGGHVGIDSNQDVTMWI